MPSSLRSGQDIEPPADAAKAAARIAASDAAQAEREEQMDIERRELTTAVV